MIVKMNKTEAAKYLGVSLSTFKNKIQKELPVIKLGRLVFFEEKDLDAYLESKKTNVKAGSYEK